jgi:hypothetical protein
MPAVKNMLIHWVSWQVMMQTALYAPDYLDNSINASPASNDIISHHEEEN